MNCGSPQARLRVYYAAFFISTAPLPYDETATPPVALPAWVAAIALFVESSKLRPPPLAVLLLPDAHTSVVESMKQQVQVRAAGHMLDWPKALRLGATVKDLIYKVSTACLLFRSNVCQ